MNRSLSSNETSTGEEETDEEESYCSSEMLRSSQEEQDLEEEEEDQEEDLEEKNNHHHHVCPAARLLHCNSSSPSSSLPPSPPKRTKNTKKSSSSLFASEEQQDINRVTSAMKIREDTLDGAEEPDTDPPQRRRTIEDISIEELSALRANLPPEYPDDESPPTLLPCLTCNRTFNPKALDRHRKVCQKLSESSKKKQVFNAQTQRFEPDTSTGGTPSPGRARTPDRTSSSGGSAGGGGKKKTSKWREKHKEFLRTIRAARGAPEGDDAAGTSPAVPIDYVQCPHCSRHFGPKAADRHIAWCREQSTRLRRTSADVALTERLKNRTKYVPPKPGQGGWRAPKKTDVISSIPPASTGPTPDLRKISPPAPHQHPLLNPYAQPRRGVGAASPGGRSHQYGGGGSLGRAAARSFSSLLQAVSNNYQSPYGQRHSASGYATPSSYSAYGGHVGGSQTPNLSRSGSFSGTTPGGFSRSASLRVSNSRRSQGGGGGRMARRRDLASDMLASVMQGMGSPARGEPEGNEADDFSSRETTLSPLPYKSYNDSKYDSPFDSKFESSSYSPSKFEVPKFEPSSKFDDLFDTKFDDPVVEQLSYDPYSAAEMQMQALLGPPAEKKSSGTGGLGAAGLGTGGITSPSPYPKRSLYASSSTPGSKQRPTRLNTALSPALSRKTSHSPSYTDMLSPAGGKSSSPWRLSPSPPPSARDRWSPHSPTHAWSPTRSSPIRDVNYGRASSSSGYKSALSPSTTNNREDRFSFSSTGSRKDERGRSPLFKDDKFSYSAGKRPLRSSLSSSGSPEQLDRLGSLSSFGGAKDESRNSFSNYGSSERTQGSGSSNGGGYTRKSSLGSQKDGTGSSTLSSLKALRSSIQGKYGANRSENSYSDTKQTRSSSSSSDSSLPPLSSPSISPSPSSLRANIRETTPTPTTATTTAAKKSSASESLDHIISSLTSIGTESSAGTEPATAAFCHDCGQKYPTAVAKFCCHCGSRRSSAFKN